MKKFALLIVSVAGNVALLALVVSSTAGNKNSTTGDGSIAVEAFPANGKKNTGGSSDTSDINPAVWKEMVSGDLAEQVKRLRDAGFPESVLRGVVSAQLSEQYQDRQNALRASAPKAPYWQNDQPADPKSRAAQRELSKEYTKQMNALVGTTMPIDDPAYLAQQRRQYGDLPREKVDQIERIKRDYNELNQEIYESAGVGSGSVTFTRDIEGKLALLEKEQRADILALMTPQEAEDYELRTGNTANQMRSQLASFNPNETEFRAIHKLQSVFDEQYNTRTLSSLDGPAQQELMRQRSEAQKDLTTQIKQTLGEQRGAEYERSVDGNFQQVYRVVERLELPKEAAVQVWNAQKEIQERMAALRTDRTLTPATRNAQMGALAQEASTRVTEALGERGYTVYKQYGGAWIQNLEQQAAAPLRPAAGARGGAGGGGGGRGGVIIQNRVIVSP